MKHSVLLFVCVWLFLADTRLCGSFMFLMFLFSSLLSVNIFFSESNDVFECH
jgi:hypothetical protein